MLNTDYTAILFPSELPSLEDDSSPTDVQVLISLGIALSPFTSLICLPLYLLHQEWPFFLYSFARHIHYSSLPPKVNAMPLFFTVF